MTERSAEQIVYSNSAVNKEVDMLRGRLSWPEVAGMANYCRAVDCYPIDVMCVLADRNIRLGTTRRLEVGVSNRTELAVRGDGGGGGSKKRLFDTTPK